MLVLPTEKRFDWKYAPVMLFSIVFLNVLVFFIYQSGDDKKYMQALSSYVQADLLKVEWPAYQDYLQEQGDELELGEYRKQFANKQIEGVVVAIVGDKNFYRYLQAHGDKLVFDPYAGGDNWNNWREQRARVDSYFYSISAFQSGLIPREFNLFTLVSSQFLHGDIMHLLSNMFFLILCGFAVEAAVGAWVFLGLYVASGMFGGLLYVVMDLQNEVPTVGASGAISGVMAMYLGVFRLRKIEFFYWVFIFAGYFRAPALLILPFYIGKELLDFFLNADSNVNFLAHAGGFIGGSASLALVYWLKPDAVNQNYVEEKQDVDPERQSLSRIFSLVESFSFDAAITEVSRHVKEYGDDFELALLRYNLSCVKDDRFVSASLAGLIRIKPRSGLQLDRLAAAWVACERLQEEMDSSATIKLAMNLASPAHVDLAEAIFERRYPQDSKNSSLGILARKLAVIFDKLKNAKKKQYYEAIADGYIAGVR